MTIATTDSAVVAVVEAPQAERSGADRGTAKVKAEFLIQRQAEPTPRTEAASEGADTPTPAPAESTGKRSGGQHQNRRQKNKSKAAHTEQGIRLCNKTASGEECTLGDKCTYSHDVAGYLAEKEADIGPSCVNIDVYGKCRYGLRCRYAGAHAAAGEEKADQFYAHNEVDKSMQIRVRKKQVAFPRTEEFEALWEREAREGAGDSAREGADDSVKGREDGGREKRQRTRRGHIDYRGKTYLAPLTTVGNLPFRRICKGYGVDITCSEMAIAGNLLQGHQSEWALVRRHRSEDVFGVQLAGNNASVLGRAAELISRECEVDFIDLNMGCPIDMVANNGGGSALLSQPKKIGRIVRTMHHVTDCDVTVKIRTGVMKNDNVAHKLVPQFEAWGAALVTLHGRSRQQRYTKLANWGYIGECKQAATRVPLFGGGDVMSWEEYWDHLEAEKQCDGIMIGRGALVKPWVFKEIEERRVWDISATERLDMMKEFARFGLEHWGTDSQGVNATRRYLLEWQSFLHRYIPAGILEVLPQRMNDRPPAFVGRNDLETLMASSQARDWIKISEMILGPTPEGFTFVPKHKSNSYED
ncbi:tRNA-dihydrouridine(47) synthase [NAD(P)(+)]-like protein [Coemansia sp. RSA 2611]|nr:tRNA-dihydrouridine(47) synthase [NAD(P)(+)]-like protein [Coemansia sp. RSA 2611]KAJ2410423.1 tRNA-dihydrouridine(47) synthase [NAD(P)(+)]-like protein [Coemansia sp. RSA 2530]KAJ2695604.1 tRNA-dihydrouridine(47) synthase [NAD(P)(+)]-like protein [Coemansia sp. IMI 209128]